MIIVSFFATLKSEVDAVEFETWVREEWSPKLNGKDGPKGMTGQIAKGDRGPAKGHYLGRYTSTPLVPVTGIFPSKAKDSPQQDARKSRPADLPRHSISSGNLPTPNGGAMASLSAS